MVKRHEATIGTPPALWGWAFLPDGDRRIWHAVRRIVNNFANGSPMTRHGTLCDRWIDAASALRAESPPKGSAQVCAICLTRADHES